MQGIYAPSRYAADQRTSTGWYLNGTSVQIARFLNATGVAIGNQTLVQQAGVSGASWGLAYPPVSCSRVGQLGGEIAVSHIVACPASPPA